MSHVLALAQLSIAPNGGITANLRNPQVLEGRPTTDFAGADEAVFQHVNDRKPGEYETMVRLGTGVAAQIDQAGINSLNWINLPKLAEKYGQIGPNALVCLFRDLSAPRTYLVADVAAGILETEDFMAGCLRELVEIGLYTDGGWAEYELTGNLAAYQGVIDREQVFEWTRLAPDFHKSGAKVIVTPADAPDKLNGQNCFLRAEPKNRSLEAILSAKLSFSGNGWKVRDTEHRPGNKDQGEPEWVSLNRRFGIICQRQEKPRPVMFFFHGALDEFSCPVILEGEAIQMALTEKAMGVLQSFRWI